MPSRLATIASTVGLHARPATRFTRKVIDARIPVTVARKDGKGVNAASVLAVMALGIRFGEEVVLSTEDPDAGAFLDELVLFLETDHDTPAGHTPLPPARSGA